jgi:hypothetical protein
MARKRNSIEFLQRNIGDCPVRGKGPEVLIPSTHARMRHPQSLIWV